MSRIKLRVLRLDFQPAENLIEENVQAIMRQIAAGQLPKPIDVRFDGESYFVRDGFHRVDAARRCGLLEIDANISSGTLHEMEDEFREMLKKLNAELRKDKP
jgi:hypothetical protein